MLAKRIIPCLDVRNGKVVKGVNFEGIRDVGDPVECAEEYNKQGADEIVFYDITASFEGRGVFLDVVRETAKKAYHLFGCAGLTRVDFFVTADGRVLLNELNTLPGFTSISMYPKLMANCGKEGKQLIAELIDLALNKA